jgi:hypothetical protein
MKQSLTDVFSVDQFGMDDARAERIYEMPPKNHFLETAGDRERQDLYDRVLPRLTTSLQRRIAVMLIIDQEPITIPEFRELGIDRQALTNAKKEVLAAIGAITLGA